ncbi:hypothetical protein HO133_006963 [Letharia lupina]|uniref:Uncharacterized protein n=1 Tax=Letharia lupina TaxID=560253 RepID=A0A8H6CST0_9LECA|nr:uncharacterized protein HO133_006963 [Letharia lupina]KAF6228852.1 hypothetical protein HO133_006963 [Letharia lupina]
MSRSLDAKKIQMHNPPANVRMSQWQGAGDQGRLKPTAIWEAKTYSAGPSGGISAIFCWVQPPFFRPPHLSIIYYDQRRESLSYDGDSPIPIPDPRSYEMQPFQPWQQRESFTEDIPAREETEIGDVAGIGWPNGIGKTLDHLAIREIIP